MDDEPKRGPWERLLLRLMGPPQLGPFDEGPDPAIAHRAAVEARDAAARTDAEPHDS